MYKLGFYVPIEALESVKQALFAVGAGRIGNYDSCCWQTLGEGQFRPLPGSNPLLGTHELLERLEEYRVEMVCEPAVIQAALVALKSSHPYETPAYDVVRLETF